MERRRTPRFGLTEPMDAHVSVLQDVQIDNAGIDDITVVASQPAIRGEKMTLRVGAADEVQMTMAVQVAHSEPCTFDRRVAFRIHLSVEGSIALGTGEDETASTWSVGQRMTASLVREHPARIGNLSRGGCLIETAARLPEGSVARVHRQRGALHADPVRVAFVHERRGSAWAYALGAEFLSLSAPSSYSLRSLAQQMADRGESPFGLSLAGPRQESNVLLTNSGLGPIDILSIVCAELEIREPARAVVRQFSGRKPPGRRLALVGGHQDTPGT